MQVKKLLQLVLKQQNEEKVIHLKYSKAKFRRAVSPVIAVVLLIALTVAAGAVIWTLTSGIIGGKNVELIIDSYAVADSDSDGAGDILELKVRNIGSDPAIINSIKVIKDGVVETSWTLIASSYTIEAIGIVKAQTLTTSQQITSLNDVTIEVKDSSGSLARKDIIVPDVLSTLPVFFDGGNFGSIDINSGGWTTFTYNTHGGGAGITVVGSDLVFQTNDDLLFYLQNSSFTMKNGIITSEFLWGDNDAIGIAFRIIDELNYYYIGYTEDHNGPQNRAGETEGTFDGPYFTYDAQFEIHKIVAGVDTLLANAVAPFSMPPGSGSSLTGPFKFVISINDNSITFQAQGTSGSLAEIFSITDTTFPNAGYFGVFSLAAQNSKLSNFQVTA